MPFEMFQGALGTTSLPLYCCLAAAAQTLFLAFLAFTSGGLVLVRGRVYSGSSELDSGVGWISSV